MTARLGRAKPRHIQVDWRRLRRQGMEPQAHPLEPFFHQAVRNSYEGTLGLHDPDMTGYIAHLLCDFSQSDQLYKIRDAKGHPVEELEAMLQASDPVNGTARSFDDERA